MGACKIKDLKRFSLFWETGLNYCVRTKVSIKIKDSLCFLARGLSLWTFKTTLEEKIIQFSHNTTRSVVINNPLVKLCEYGTRGNPLVGTL